jgi:hypothetical protein
VADAIDVYLDLSKPQGGLVKSLNDTSVPAFGPFYQGASLNLRVYPVVPNGSRVTAPFFTKVPLSNLNLQVVVGPAPGTEAIKAAQYTWTKQTVADSDGQSGYFYATLDLNTTDLNTAVGALTSVVMQMDFLLQRGAGNFTPVYQADITIKAVVKDPSGAASIPTPALSYLTRDECFNLFVMWDNRLRAANNGKAPILTSPDGTHTRQTGVDNDGSPTENLT